MYELQKNGLYYQSLTFSPIVGLLKNDSESPNVTIYTLSKYMTIVFSNRFIKPGEQLRAAFYTSSNQSDLLFKRLFAGDLFYRISHERLFTFDVNESRCFKDFEKEKKWCEEFDGNVKGSYKMLMPKHKQIEE